MTMQVNMSAVATPAIGASPGANVGAANGAQSLLPPPAAGTTNVEDVVGILLKMSSDMSDQQMRTGKMQVDVADQQRKVAAERRKEALDKAAEAARKAREAKEHESGGLFSCITDNIGVVGLVGLATFNWGLVAADVTAHDAGWSNGSTDLMDASAALFGGPLLYLAEQGAKSLAPEEMSESRVAATLLGGPMGYALERATEKLVPGDYQKMVDDKTSVKDDDVRMANKIALMVALAAVAAGSVVLSGGTSTPAVIALVGIGISTATQVMAETGALKEIFGEKAAIYVALGGAIAGAALTLGGSALSAATAVDKAAEARIVVNALNGAKSIAEGTASVLDGVADLEAADYQHDADIANTDAQEQKNVMARIEKIVDAILDDLKEAHKSVERATSTLNETLQINNQTLLQAGAMKV